MAIQDKVLFLGPEASYTHQAALDTFSETRYLLQPATEIEQVFQGVQDGTAAFGVVPIENSSNGAVVPTMDLLANIATAVSSRARSSSSSSSRTSPHPDVLICGEVYVRVQHCLLGRRCPSQNKEGAMQGGTPCLAHIKTIHSHPQAWGQCKRLLSGGSHHPALARAKRLDCSSTAQAARAAALDGSGGSAAIASRAAARAHGLDVLVEDVSDFAGNTTRFFVLRRCGGELDVAAETAAAVVGSSSSLVQGLEKRYNALLAFTVQRPVVVTEALAAFTKHGVPISNVTTRPSGDRAWERVFFVEIVLGESSAVEAALMDLGRVAAGWRWLGSWESKLDG